VLRGKGNFFMSAIGPYDKWAIRYGYMDVKADSPLGEKHVLHQVAARSTEPGHAFMTDENADNWDPYVVRFDGAKDPVNYAAKMLEASQRIRKYAIEQLPKPGESYALRTGYIMSSITQTFRQGRNVSRFVGGIQARRDFRAEQHLPTLAPVDAQTQRQAVRLIARHVFSADSFDIPGDVLMSLSQDPNAPMAAGWTAPIRDLVSLQQSMLYAQLMSSGTTDRIAENAFKLNGAKDIYTLEEHFGILLATVFSEIGQNKNISPSRRDLQRFAISALIQQSTAAQGGVNEDVRALAADALRRLERRFEAQANASKGLDGITQAHVRESHATIVRFLNRQVTGNR
jgi:hypothetical protein